MQLLAELYGVAGIYNDYELKPNTMALTRAHALS